MAKIDEDTIRQIKEANDIVDVISSYIPLTQKGKNYFGVCPFHDDHSPSRSVSREKQIYRCFTCENSGNVITFVENYLKVSFVEALDILAKNAGIALNIKKENVNTPHKELYDIYEIATSYYKNNLNTASGKEAMEYLKKRGLNKEPIDYFDIGLSLDTGLVSTLSKKFDINKLKDIGLASSSGSDMFKNRIMFTLCDIYGNKVGYSARKYKESDEAKYINTTDTIIFKKGSTMYNFHRAKDHIRKQKEIIISEGQMEIIRLHTVGIDNAVALMGTSFTKEHLELIKNMKINVVLNLDQDDAGKRATISIGDTLMENGIMPTVILFSGYKDTDELILAKGKEAFTEAYKNRVSFIDFKLNYLKNNKDLNDASSASTYIKESIEAINKIDDDILRELKIKELSKEFDIDESLIKSKITNNKKVVKKEEKVIIQKKTYNKYDKSELKILYFMMIDPKIIEYYENNLGYLNDPQRKKLAREVVAYYTKNKSFDLSDFICYTTQIEDLNNLMNEVLSFNDTDNYTMEEIEDYSERIKELRIKRQIEKLSLDMKNCIDKEEKKRIASKIENIKKEVLKW